MGSPGCRRRDATGSRTPSRSHGRSRNGSIRARVPTPGTADAEAGQSIILIIGMIALALLTISVVLAATAVNVQARKLLSVADGAVAAAADNFELDATGQSDATLHLDPAEVRSAAAKYLDDIGAAADFVDLRIVSAGVQGDGVTAQLRLGAVVHPPIVGWVVPAGVGISVESKARTLLSR
ncbi:hypothetical protein ACFY5D_16780 [Paeniglutamicibacter sp. NPDC012692]|uniref:hypothetical protein n=1 Tax=Paeniglutamicibacter sp. NPDC012692 TaxID=3364388 RepID=UPI0036A414C6